MKDTRINLSCKGRGGQVQEQNKFEANILSWKRCLSCEGKKQKKDCELNQNKAAEVVMLVIVCKGRGRMRTQE